MAYCPECGAEVSADAKFCTECGNTLQPDAEESDSLANGGGTATIEDAVTEDAVTEDKGGGIDKVRAVASGVMGLIVGLIVAFAFTNIGGSGILFFVTLAGVGYYLYSKQETVKLAIGMGLYIAALWTPLSPIIFYIPLVGSASSETAAGAGQAIGSIFGMVIYGFIGLIIGLVLAAIGYFVRKGERE